MRGRQAFVRASLLGAAAAGLCSASLGHAQPTSAKVTAQALFEEGRKLVADGKFAEACPKLADSERLDPSPSTVLNLANCWEKLGRTATAWATYKQAQSDAVAARRSDYATVAERHAEALAPNLAKLVIVVAQPTEGMQLKRDGVVVDAAEWGTAIPVDPGTHTVEGSAPGYKKWSTDVQVPRDGARVTVAVPLLEAAPAPVAEPPASAPTHPEPAPALATPTAPPQVGASHSWQRTLGLVASGAGALGLGASVVLAFIADAKNQSSLQHGCSARECRTQTAYDDRKAALSLGDASTVAFVAGAVVLAGGAYLWFSAPSEAASPPVSAGLLVTPGYGGAVVQGAW